jgi:nucleotidyltransferase/DNA polymerase involved in DNA repair
MLMAMLVWCEREKIRIPVDFLFHINGDMSERVMTLIESMVPAAEVYSIDESFADLTGVPGCLDALGCRIRSTVLQGTGIPVGVGIAGTKTLANHGQAATGRNRRGGQHLRSLQARMGAAQYRCR